MARLARHVHVHHQGGTTVFGPDDEVPSWAAKLITAPNAWAEESGSKTAGGSGSSAAASSPSSSETPAKRNPGRPPKSSESAR